MEIKRGGRPLKEEKKNKRFEFRITEREQRKIQELFDESSYDNLSEMILDVLINRKFQHKYAQFDNEKLIELGKYSFQIKKIGANIHQILKNMNQKKYNILDKKDIIEANKIIQICQKEIESFNRLLENI